MVEVVSLMSTEYPSHLEICGHTYGCSEASVSMIEHDISRTTYPSKMKNIRHVVGMYDTND